MIKAYIIIFFSHELKKEYFSSTLVDPFITLGENDWKFKIVDTNQPLDSFLSFKGGNYIFEKTFNTVAARDADYFYRTLGQYYIYTTRGDYEDLLGI